MVHVLLSDCPTCGRPLVGMSGYEAAAVTVHGAKKFGHDFLFLSGRIHSRNIS